MNTLKYRVLVALDLGIVIFVPSLPKFDVVVLSIIAGLWMGDAIG